MREHYTNGYEAGVVRASWAFDGNTSSATYSNILEMMEIGDPALYDIIDPGYPLSGEWAGESMVETLGDDFSDDDADQYEAGYSDGFWLTIGNVCAYHVGSTPMV